MEISDIARMAASNAYNRGNNKATMGMQDFLNLLVAQLQNQDMMNPMSDTDFMGQMAQFSSLQAMQDLMHLSNTSYSISLMGKEVTAARMQVNANGQSTGQLFTMTGVVTGVGLFEGSPVIYIGDERFLLSEVMIVGKMPGSTQSESKPSTGGDNGNNKVEECETCKLPEDECDPDNHGCDVCGVDPGENCKDVDHGFDNDPNDGSVG